MVTSKQCLDRYGDPIKENNMIVWDIPTELEIGVIPKKLYCNKDLVKPLEQAFRNLIKTDKVKELKTWDGCFNIRQKRGLSSMSLHSWGIAIDVNAAWNGLNKEPQLSKEFVKCFLDAGFEWGGTWTRKDGMHFQLKELPNFAQKDDKQPTEKIHIVQKGDSLSKIATLYKTTITKLKKDNNLQSDIIQIGQKIKI